MKQLEKLPFREVKNVISNPHFWVIVFIVLALAFSYYARYIFPRYYHAADELSLAGNLKIFEFLNDMHGCLFFIPFVYAAVIFKWRGAVVTWILSMALMLPEILYFSSDIPSLMRNIFFSFVPLMIFLFVYLQLKWRKKEREALAEREAERQAYMSQIFKAQEDERHRIAQELHDDTIQTLLVIANRTQSLMRDENNRTNLKVRADMEWIRDAILNVSDDVRRLSLDLRPGILDNIGLVPALTWLVDRLNQEDGVNAQMKVSGKSYRLNHETEVAIFRIVQEALNNVRRHSKAAMAAVFLEFSEDGLKIAVQDNGKGFILPRKRSDLTTKGKLGLAGMQQRTEFLGGVFNIHSDPGKGTLVSFEFSNYSIDQSRKR
ncbi:hypothetical protein ES703_65033 [subsurface metagenome]